MQLSESSGTDAVPDAALVVLKSKACRTAVMFGDLLTRSACVGLITELRDTRLWSSCAHGRPTLAPIVSLPHFRAAVQQLGQAP
jgi:DNA mismatch repair protein MLH3